MNFSVVSVLFEKGGGGSFFFFKQGYVYHLLCHYKSIFV